MSTPPDDSPDVLQSAGVKRLNKRPILIVATLGSIVALSLAYAVNRRAAANKADALPHPPPTQTQQTALDSSAVVTDLTKGIPDAGLVPIAAPARPVTAVTAVTAANSAPAEATSDATATGPTDAATLPPVPGAPAAAASTLPATPDDDTALRLRAALQHRLQVYESALSSPTRVNFSTAATPAAPDPNQALALALANNARPDLATLQAAALRGQQPPDPNMQDSKETFRDKLRSAGYLPSTRQAPVSPYELKLGSVVPAIMVSGINSDLPGDLLAQVSQNVFDTATGKHLLIPQGAKLFGVYDSRVSYGQNRVLVAWTRLTYPDGSSLDLAGMSGADQAGYGGFADRTDNHYLKIFGSSLMLSMISAGVQLSQPEQSAAPNATPTPGQEIAAAVGQELGRTSTQMLEKNLNIQPTLTVRPGYRFNVMVSKDVAFLRPYNPNR